MAIPKSKTLFRTQQIQRLLPRTPKRLPSEYIESVRYIPRSLSPFPGKFSFDKFPYFREIINQFSPENPTRRVYVMKGNQIGATTGLYKMP